MLRSGTVVLTGLARPSFCILCSHNIANSGEFAIGRRESTISLTFEEPGALPNGLLRRSSTQQVTGYIRRQIFEGKLMAVSIVPGDFFAGVPDAMRIHKRHSRVIMKALEAGDGETAEREIISMLRQEASLVIELLTERSVIEKATTPDAG